LEQIRHNVHAGHPAEAAGGGDGGIAAAGGDIEDALTGAKVGRLTESFADQEVSGADDSAVARGPGFLLVSLELDQVRRRCCRDHEVPPRFGQVA
jgi:hypothetical protein